MNRRLLQTLLLLTVYAVAMGLVEAACVISLKRLYFPEGWHAPFHGIPTEAVGIEQAREVATLVMIAAVALLGRPSFRVAVARGLWIFGVWDIAYYAFLRGLTGFPGGPGDLDIVFLVPHAWIAPVWLPIAGSFACLAVAFLLLRSRGDG